MCATRRRLADPGVEEGDRSVVLRLGVSREVVLNDGVVAGVGGGEGVAHSGDDAEHGGALIGEQFLQGFAKVGWIGIAAGVIRLTLQPAGEDLLLEAVHAVGNGLQIIEVAEARCNGGLRGEPSLFGGEDGLGC